MEKLKRKILKHDNILAIGFILSIILPFSFFVELRVSDELWNFSNIYKMGIGYEIYTELNVITTPLYFYIGKIFCFFLGNNYLGYRLYNNVFLNVLFLFCVYQLLKKINIGKKNALFIVCVLTWMMKTTGTYNLLAISFVILGILFLVKEKKLSWKRDIIQGIIVFLIFMSKQNIVVYYVVALIFYRIWQIKKIKPFLKHMLITLISAGILLILFLIYLSIKGQLFAFIDYTILGLKEFAKYNVVKDLLSNIYAILLLLGLGIIQIIFFKIANNKKIPFKEEERKNIVLLACFSFMLLGVAYPILNEYHLRLVAILPICACSYVLIILLKDLLKNKKIEKIKMIILFLIVTVISVIGIRYNIAFETIIGSEEYYFPKNSPYYGAVISENTLEEIDEILQYINQEEQAGRKVKIISCHANLYMNLLGRNNGEMDLPFYGNLGGDGEDGLIEQIKQLKNTKILILTQEDTIYQESKKVMNYIKENYPKEGEIRQFSIYYAE